MDPDWKTFPSLTALRAFEAAARLGGFSVAARSLNVTHAAVAQQVRALEATLGLPLIRRDGRGMALTPEGERLATLLLDGFGAIQAGIDALRSSRADRPLRVSLTPGFAAQWLMPRLRGFWAAHPDIPLSLHPEARVVDLAREGIDVALRYGAGDWPGVRAEYLTSARYVIVGAPSLAGTGARPTRAEMQAMPWITAADWPEQSRWLQSRGFDYDALSRNEVPNEELALAAARQGLGLIVESHALVEDSLSTGRLVMLEDSDDPLPAYFVVTLPGPQRPALRAFTRWLAQAA